MLKLSSKKEKKSKESSNTREVIFTGSSEMMHSSPWETPRLTNSWAA